MTAMGGKLPSLSQSCDHRIDQDRQCERCSSYDREPTQEGAVMRRAGFDRSFAAEAAERGEHEPDHCDRTAMMVAETPRSSLAYCASPQWFSRTNLMSAMGRKRT